MLTIEMSTVAFYRGDIPRELSLCDCAIPIERGPQLAFTGFYGTQGKQDGFMAARLYAQRHGLSYTVVDFLADLQAQNPLTMKLDELSNFDFLNFSRMSRALGSAIEVWMADALPVSANENTNVVTP